MKKIKYIGEGRYSGDDNKKNILVSHGQIIEVSDEKAKYLFKTFPKSWEEHTAIIIPPIETIPIEETPIEDAIKEVEPVSEDAESIPSEEITE